jgi:hypothetical protein
MHNVFVYGLLCQFASLVCCACLPQAGVAATNLVNKNEPEENP